MRTVRILAATLVAFVLAALALTLPASAATATEVGPTCAVANASFTTHVSNRPDSAIGGGTWALDTFTRKTVVTCVGIDTYQVDLVDQGTFTPVAAAHSPQAGVPIHNLPFTGSFDGGTSFKVVSADKPVDPKAGANGQYSSADWAALVFPKGDITQGSFRWDYAHCSDHWTNAATSSGDILGKVCPTKPVKPTPPTSTVTAPPTTVVQPVPGPTKVVTVTVTNPTQFVTVPNTVKGVNTGDGSLS
jgi:hypothetical protein